MIKFFRTIRQQLLTENKLSKYLLYAIGEILLVVIGILIALQINNWNDVKKQSKKEIGFLVNLENDLKSDIEIMMRHDATYAINENAAAIGLNLFYRTKTVQDMDSISVLTPQLWNELYINQNTYTEMINSGNLYTMKNKILKEAIMTYYLDAVAYKYYIRQIINELSQLYVRTPELNPYKFLISQVNNSQVDFSLIDTTWINKPQSPTYLALFTYLSSNLESNIRYRRRVYKRNSTAAKELVTLINAELDIRNK